MRYQIIDAILNKLDPELSASEAHGMATGMISVNHNTNPGHWLQEILQSADEPNPDEQAALEGFYADIYELLVNRDFEFAVFLPGDETLLSERLEALRHWCQGYLFGISHGNVNKEWPDDVLEIIRDITELTKLESDVSDEDAENDLMEITEYVKAGVIFVNAELNPVHLNSVH